MDSLVKDNILSNEAVRIETIGDYINYIRKISDVIIDKASFAVFRGEPERYPHPCRPNIFRENVLIGNRLFEKNIYDVMRQNGISRKDNYLEMAIDAQHGEFPSRLLDVSYNCLVALYFATTPFYHKPEDSLDTEDGMVYIIRIDEVYSPSAENAITTFDAIIKKKPEWIDNVLFSHDHKFIDYSKQNARIVAQQGAFILFQGETIVDLPYGMVYGIVIPKEKKSELRKQLNDLFGIHTGTIYPEPTNMVSTIKEKSHRIIDDDFSLSTELARSVNAFAREMYYYIDYLLRNKVQEKDEVFILIEKIISSYRQEILRCRQLNMLLVSEDSMASIINCVKEYNSVLCKLNKDCVKYCGCDFTIDKFLIEEVHE